MRRLVPDVFRGPRKKQTFALVIIVVIVVLAYVDWTHFRNRQNRAAANTDAGISVKQQSESEQNYAAAKIKSKDYDQAMASCISVASDKFYAEDYKDAKSYLQDCIKQIPDAKVSWLAFSLLADTAQKLSDEKLEKSSLTTAIAKASAAGSDASAEKIAAMKKRLGEL